MGTLHACVCSQLYDLICKLGLILYEVARNFELYASRIGRLPQRTVVDYTPDVWGDALFHGYISFNSVFTKPDVFYSNPCSPTCLFGKAG